MSTFLRPKDTVQLSFGFKRTHRVYRAISSSGLRPMKIELVGLMLPANEKKAFGVPETTMAGPDVLISICTFPLEDGFQDAPSSMTESEPFAEPVIIDVPLHFLDKEKQPIVKPIDFAVLHLTQEDVLKSTRPFNAVGPRIKREPHAMQKSPESSLFTINQFLFCQKFNGNFHNSGI